MTSEPSSTLGHDPAAENLHLEAPGDEPADRPRARLQSHPLGPMLLPTADHEVRTVRAWALITGALAAGLLVVAASLAPDPAGLGTHQQLGLPPCSLVVMTGYPCPTCGMTTAFAHTARGQLFSALCVQPAGTLLALLVAAWTIGCAYAAITGRAVRLNWLRIRPFWTTLLILGVILGGWGGKIAIGLASGQLPASR